MTNCSNYSDRDRLEKIFNLPEQQQAIKSNLFLGLNRIFKQLIETCIASNELRIWQECDRFGNKVWHAYDPVTRRRASMDSEAEIRAWIENRYYQ